VREIVVLRCQVARDYDSAAGVLDSEGDSGTVVMIDRYRRHPIVCVAQDLMDRRVLASRKIGDVELQGVPKLREVFEGTLRAKQPIDERGRTRVGAGSARSEDPKIERLVVVEISRLHESWEITAVIDVEVGEENGVEVVEIDAHLTEPHEGARTDVDENARDAVNEDDVARCRASKAARAARAEDDELDGRVRSPLW
jgi:hypothetical protein